MNKLLSIIALCSALFMGTAYAHGDHGVISGQKALSITATLIKKMTFKDVGFAIGKLDETWKRLDKSQLAISSVKDSYYVVSAKNPKSDRKVYFKIAKNGQVLAANSHDDF